MSKDPREAIERAARQHRDASAKPSDPSVLAGKKRVAARQTLEESLGEASGGSILLIVAMTVLVCASMFVLVVVLPRYTQATWLVPAGSLVSFVGSMGIVLTLGSRALTAWHAGAVRRLPEEAELPPRLHELPAPRDLEARRAQGRAASVSARPRVAGVADRRPRRGERVTSSSSTSASKPCHSASARSSRRRR